MAMEGITYSKDAHPEDGRTSTKHEKLCPFSEIQDFERDFR